MNEPNAKKDEFDKWVETRKNSKKTEKGRSMWIYILIIFIVIAVIIFVIIYLKRRNAGGVKKGEKGIIGLLTNRKYEQPINDSLSGEIGDSSGDSSDESS